MPSPKPVDCPQCDTRNNIVIYYRKTGNTVVRRRRCRQCRHIFMNVTHNRVAKQPTKSDTS